MSVPAQPRLPLAPLLAASGADRATVTVKVCVARDWTGEDRTGTCELAAPITILAELVDRTRCTVLRWQREGIPLLAAEEICDFLGFHPCEVWHDAYLEAVLDDAEPVPA